MHISRISSAILFLLVSMMLFSCKQRKERPPIPEKKMEAVLLDLHLAEVYSQGLGLEQNQRYEKNYDTLPDLYLTVLKHYDLSLQSFDEAIQWYKEHPILLDSLYQNIINRFNELKAKEGIMDIEEQVTVTAPQKPESLRDTLSSARRKDSAARKMPLKDSVQHVQKDSAR